MTHLSDEAVAAFADGVLTGHARARAARHTEQCVECADAVRGQREAVLALRTASAPELPCGLLDRLRGLPQIIPISSPPTVVMPDGTAMLSTSDTSGSMAALVPPRNTVSAEAAEPAEHRSHLRAGPVLTTAAMAVLAGALAAGAGTANGAAAAPGTGNREHTVGHTVGHGTTPADPLFTSASVFPSGGR